MATTLRQRNAPTASSKKERRDSDVLSTSSDEDTSPATSHLENTFPPFEVPNYTIKEVLGAIPAECFERSALISSAYVARDFAFVIALGYAASFIEPALGYKGETLNGWAGFAAKWAAWAAYWTVQGWVMTGIWILGHECGHQAFSTSKTINNTAGLFLHSFVLVPYHSWRISHAKHHAATGHMTRDEVFVPRTLAERKVKANPKKVEVAPGVHLDELLEDAPIYRLGWLLVQQLFGWPAYLFTNASGQAWYPTWTNHFDPKSLIFDARHRSDVLISDAFLIGMFTLLTLFGQKMGGFGEVVKYYGIPYLAVNHWLVMITYLQHTDPQLPHYRADQWNFVRGALCTIDRNLLGPVGPYLMHGITETHIAHHLSSKIPHHNAWKATAALKEFLGPHYAYSEENMFVSLWKSYRQCRYVDNEGSVLMYNDAYGRKRRTVAVADVPSDSGVEFE
ncbi:hypothetical protein JCM5353_008791 [Sporobolomyces roseus]